MCGLIMIRYFVKLNRHNKIVYHGTPHVGKTSRSSIARSVNMIVDILILRQHAPFLRKKDIEQLSSWTNINSSKSHQHEGHDADVDIK